MARMEAVVCYKGKRNKSSSSSTLSTGEKLNVRKRKRKRLSFVNVERDGEVSLFPGRSTIKRTNDFLFCSVTFAEPASGGHTYAWKIHLIFFNTVLDFYLLQMELHLPAAVA